MAERRVQMRQGRRDRRDGDVQAKEDVKRRSRSEGPTARRVAHSMDVGSGNGRRGLPGQTAGNNFEKKVDSKITAQSKNQLSTLCTDQRGFADPGPSTSDSDSDHMQWTKNPLMVRKVKKNKSDKRITSTEKNGSSCYNQLGARNTNRESWVFLTPEGDQGELNTEPTKNEGGSNPGSLKSKYQKLEEMRKRRIDIAVTSDEETTPESRISRLRQRALQGGLVNQKKPENFALTVSDHNGWTPTSDHRIAQTVMSDQGSRISRAQPSHDPGHSFSQQPLPLDCRNELSTSHSSPAPVVSQRLVSRSPMELTTQATQPQLGSRSVSIVSYAQPTAVRSPGTGYTQPLQQRQQLMHQRQHNEIKQSVVKPFTNSEVADVSSPSPAVRQQFYTIPEPQAAHRTYHSSSPEFQVRKINSTVRIPSADSIYDSVAFSQQSEKTRNGVHRTNTETQQVFAQVNPPSVDKVVVRRGTTVQNIAADELLMKGDKRHILPQFNEVVELRLKTQPHSKERPLSQGFEATKLLQSVHQQDGGVKSEDSLDELIESNIQYLEREIDRSKTKKTGVSVSRSSSLPDPRRVTATISKPSVTVSGQQQSGLLSDQQQQSGLLDSQQQPGAVSVCTRTNSKLHFHVPLRSTSLQPTPQLLIAEENQFSDSAYPAQSTAYPQYNTNKIDRKYSYDSKTRPPRSNKDDLSKSDTQLNAAIVAPTYCYPMLHPDYNAGRSCISDQNLSQDKGSSRLSDRGMFSDVDYDIEVSERVKKWEKFMKKDPHLVGADVKKPVSLSTIQEKLEGDSLMMPSELRKSLRTSQLYVDSAISTHPQLNVVNIKPANSDPALHFSDHSLLSRENARSGIALNSPVSYYTNASNTYAPQLAPVSYSQARSTNPVSTTSGLIMSPHELRQHMLANKNYKETVTTESQMQGSDSALEKESAVKRVSRYKDEMDELQVVKQESVRDLRRRFDERNNSACEDEPRTETRVAKVCPSSKEDVDVNWAQMILGLEDRIKDMEVWSPNMQSTQGIVSIERVQARTLQTIPFSEDPFWKEIEEMTTFDPNNLGSNQAVSSSAQGEMKSVTLEMPSPQSCTLPSQPRQQSGVSVRERLQRSKSLYTPNITPLTISVDSFSAGKSSSLERSSNTDKYNAPNALDEVLEDIRSSLERKPLSPKKKPGDSSDSHRSSPGPSWTSELIKSRPERSRAPIMADAVQVSKWDSPGMSSVGQRGQPVSAIITSTQKAPPPAGAMVAGQYHLDPLLLRQKLLSTGLVEEEHADEAFRHQAPRQHTPVTASKPVAIAPPQTIVRSAIAPTQQPPLPSRTFFQQQEKLSQVMESQNVLPSSHNVSCYCFRFCCLFVFLLVFCMAFCYCFCVCF